MAFSSSLERILLFEYPSLHTNLNNIQTNWQRLDESWTTKIFGSYEITEIPAGSSSRISE